jgi:hypothetical protein
MREVRLALLVVALTAIGCTRPNPALRPGAVPFVDGSPAADRSPDMGELMPVPEPAGDGGSPETPERADTDVDVGAAQVDVAVDVAVADVIDSPGVDSPGVEGALSADGSPPDAASDLPPDGPPSVNIAAGLRAQWTFNEGTGTVARDLVGGNLGTLQGGASFVPSAIPKVDFAVGRYAAHLDGDNAHVTIAIQSLPSLEAPKTIAFWLLPQVVSHPALRTILALTGSAGGGGIRLGTDGGRPAMWQPGQNQGDIVAPPLAAPAWHHLVYTWDGQRHRLYLDGTFAGESSRAQALAGAIAVAVVARAAPDGSDEIYAGDVDDLRIYDRVINQAEMDRLRRGE